jgi:hypothetical protein
MRFVFLVWMLGCTLVSDCSYHFLLGSHLRFLAGSAESISSVKQTCDVHGAAHSFRLSLSVPDFLMVPVRQPKVALQLPTWGGVSVQLPVPKAPLCSLSLCRPKTNQELTGRKRRTKYPYKKEKYT